VGLRAVVQRTIACSPRTQRWADLTGAPASLDLTACFCCCRRSQQLTKTVTGCILTGLSDCLTQCVFENKVILPLTCGSPLQELTVVLDSSVARVQRLAHTFDDVCQRPVRAYRACNSNTARSGTIASAQSHAFVCVGVCAQVWFNVLEYTLVPGAVRAVTAGAASQWRLLRAASAALLPVSNAKVAVAKMAFDQFLFSPVNLCAVIVSDAALLCVCLHDGF
jgi:hypothetical protein